MQKKKKKRKEKKKQNKDKKVDCQLGGSIDNDK